MLRARVEFAYGRTGRRAIQCDATRPPVKFSLRNRSAIGSALGVLLLAAAFGYRWLAPHGAAEPGNDVPGPAVPAMVGLPASRPLPTPTNAIASPTPASSATPEAEADAAETGDVTAETQAGVDDALAKADAAFAAQRLVAPADDNALHWYMAALALDPKNRAARNGRDRAVEQALARAAQAVDAGDVDAAKQLADPIAAAMPDAAGLAELRKRIEQLPLAQTLLREAAQRMAAGNRYEPRGASALDSYLAVRVLDPANAVAERGLVEIEQAMLSRALAAASEDQFAIADELLARAAEFLPGSQAQLETRTRILALRNDRFQGLVSRALAALDARNIELAEQLATRATEVGADAEAVQALRQRIANARLYDHLEPGAVFNDAFTSRDGNGPQLVVVPVGSFQMGSTARERGHRRDEEPQHEVAITRPFALGRTEISVAEFRRFIGRTNYVTDAQRIGNSSYYDEPKGRMATGKGIDWRRNYAGQPARDDDPVVHVSWTDAQAYVAWLSEATGKRYRLPSEAEFEYAVRAGTETRYWWGDGAPPRAIGNFTGGGDESPSRRRWTKGFPRYGDGYWGPAPVAKFAPNRFGLYDMGGNVSEWVEDCWHDSYLRAPDDGSAWVNKGCGRRVVRGGSWGSAPDQVRSAFRLYSAPDVRSARVGFRVARDL